jgi:GNAT superfamily N-acetyltransferase
MAIVCLASRTPAGRSAISPQLRPDEAVAIPRADVHWVITEYGTAYLFGRSLAERAIALIDIAHPDVRSELLDAAIASGLVGRKQQLRSRTAYPVAEVREARLRDGREVQVQHQLRGGDGLRCRDRGPASHERIVAASSYYLNPASGLAEVAYMVDPDWQGAGLGSILHARLVDYARKHGARGLTADVLPGNSRMMRIFERGDHSLTVRTDAGVADLTMLF